MNKKTTLDDSAGIYEKREQQTERQKLKNMTKKEKFSYFKTYYAKKVILSLLGLAIIFSLLYQVLSPKPEEILSIAIINGAFDDTKFSTFEKDIDQYFHLNKEKETIRIDSTYYISDNDVLGSSIGSLQKLTTYIATQGIDIIIADPKEFDNLIKQGNFVDLKEALPSDLYQKVSADLYKGAALKDPSDINNTEYGKEADYGIRLDNNEVYKTSGDRKSVV